MDRDRISTASRWAGRYDGALGVVAAIEAAQRAGACSVFVFRGEESAASEAAPRWRRKTSCRACFSSSTSSRGQSSRALACRSGSSPGSSATRAASSSSRVKRGTRDRARWSVARMRSSPPRPRSTCTGCRARNPRSGCDDRPGRGRARWRERHSLARPAQPRRPRAGRRQARCAGWSGRVRAQLSRRVRAVRGRCPQAFRDAIADEGLPLVELSSGAGHDAGILAAAGVDAAMLFVRSLNGGVSHSPDELSSDEDVLLAVDVLAAALGRATSR